MKKDSRSLFQNILAIAVPLGLQSMLGFLVNLVDTVMVGKLGTVALAGVSQANQIFFLVAMTVPGIAAGASVLISQAWGKGDIERIHKVLAYAYRTALVFVVILMFVVIAFPKQVMSIYTPEEETIRIGSEYLRVIVWSYFFYTITNITTGVLRSVRTVNICLYSAIVSLILNISGNYLLIEGHLGFPALGVTGAAIATLAARIGEFILIVWYVYRKEDKIRIRVQKMLHVDKKLANVFFSTGIPVICNEMFWGLGVSAQAIVLGRLGNEVVSANSVAGSVTQLTSVLCQGLSAAACVIIGNTIGAEKYEEILPLKKTFQRIAVFMGLIVVISKDAGVALICSALTLVAIPLVPGIYHIKGETMAYCRQLMYVMAFILPFMELQSMNMMGLLRGGGDVKFQMANDLIFLWGVTVPMGFVMAFLVKAPVMAVYATLKCDQVIKVFTSEWRLRSGKWIHNVNEK